MQKFAAGGGMTMQQRCWAFLAIFLVSGIVVVSQASPQTESVQREQSLIELNEDNWRLMLKGEWMVEL